MHLFSLYKQGHLWLQKKGPFSSLVIEPLEKSGHQMWPVTPFLPRQFCKTWSESFVKASQMTKKMARVFCFFRFQSWWHYTFEGRISLTWSNDSGFSGWSAQLFACSFLLCEMSTSKPLDIFQRTPSGKLVHSNTWKETKTNTLHTCSFSMGTHSSNLKQLGNFVDPVFLIQWSPVFLRAEWRFFWRFNRSRLHQHCQLVSMLGL